MTRHYCAPVPASFEDFCSFLEQSSCLPKDYFNSPYIDPLKRVWETMLSAGARSLLLQDRVRDPDFFAEHQAYYLGQHRYVSPLCARVHAFRTELVAGATDPIADLIDQAAAQEEAYIGFVTIRPLNSAPVAATILQSRRDYIIPCNDRFPVHIAGETFHAIGTPFLQQDNSVGACAQASIWMALRTQRRRAGNSAFNTAELTLAATRYLMEDRVFPGRRGLTIGQMLQAIRFAGHEPCVIQIPTLSSPHWPATRDYRPADVSEAKLAIGPYVESGLPVILCLVQPRGEGHAVTAIGRTLDGPPPKMTPNVLVPSALGGHKFVIHNDSSGPYLELEARPVGNYDGWHIEDVRSIIVPMPDGVTVTAAEVHASGARWLGSLIPPFAAGMQIQPTLRDGIVVRQFLMGRHAFRSHMHKHDPGATALKHAGRSMDLPPWVWVYEGHLHDAFAAKRPSRVALLVFDATSDLDHGELPLVAHLNGALLDEKRPHISMSWLTQTVMPSPSTRYIRSDDDHLALPIPPQTHI